MSEQQDSANPVGPDQARELEVGGGVRDEFTAPVHVQNPEEARANEEENAAHAREQIVERGQPGLPESKQPECRQNMNENMGLDGSNMQEQGQRYTQAPQERVWRVQENPQRHGGAYGPIHNQQDRRNNQWGPYNNAGNGQGNVGNMRNQDGNPWPYAGNPDMSMGEALQQSTGPGGHNPVRPQIHNQ